MPLTNTQRAMLGTKTNGLNFAYAYGTLLGYIRYNGNSQFDHGFTADADFRKNIVALIEEIESIMCEASEA